MIVIGTDTHKRSHTAAAVDAAGSELSVRTAPARSEGFEALLGWGRSLGRERAWALEDCRHVSGSFERFLIARGERVVRVAPKLMAGARRGQRERGKSDPIDALAVARAALREGIASLPQARLAGRPLAQELERLAETPLGGQTLSLPQVHPQLRALDDAHAIALADDVSGARRAELPPQRGQRGPQARVPPEYAFYVQLSSRGYVSGWASSLLPARGDGGAGQQPRKRARFVGR
jgi:Transposase